MYKYIQEENGKRMSSAKFSEKQRQKTTDKGCHSYLHSACIVGKISNNLDIFLEMTEIQICVLNISTNKLDFKRKKKNSIQKIVVHYVHL